MATLAAVSALRPTMLARRARPLTTAPSNTGSTPLRPKPRHRLRRCAAQASTDSVPDKQDKLTTQLARAAPAAWDSHAASAPPLYQTATFAQPGAIEGGAYDYTRSGNPSRDALQDKWASVEGADGAFAFSSGMSALATAVRLCKAGDRIVAGDDLYGGTSRLLSRLAPEMGLDVEFVDLQDPDATKRAIQGHGAGFSKAKAASLVMIETPTNPRMRVVDIASACGAARAVGALSCVDNSIMTALYQRPLDLGADISMTSATKFVAGHSDVTAGLLAVRGRALCERVAFLQNAEGTGLAPFEAWLASRGLKTMALRMERQISNAEAIAATLEAHPRVTKVHYPGLESHPGSALHAAQASGPGSVLSFETGSLEASKHVVDNTRLFGITVSFGSVSSTISLPCYMSHASIPKEVREARGLPDDLVRVSAGIEDAGDLIGDLQRALDEAPWSE